MELRSITVLAVTIYSRLFLLTEHIDEYGKMVLFCFMFITNLIFLLFWFYFTFGYYIGKIYLNCDCCKKIFSGKFKKWVVKVVHEAGTEIVTDITSEDLKHKNPKHFSNIVKAFDRED